jgi:hypothetical protein
MAQIKVVSGRKGIVGSNVWDEILSVLHLGEDLVTEQCTQLWLLKLKKPSEKLTGWDLQL